jgi:hypothetical protein
MPIKQVLCVDLSAVSFQSNYSFARLIIGCLWRPIATTIFPRAANIGFTYAQTFLIAAAIKQLETPIASREKNHAYGLIGATVLIYFGRTVGYPT